MTMANHIYPTYKQALMSASANVSLTLNDTTNGPYVALVNIAGGAYTYVSSHSFWSDVSANAIGGSAGVNIGSPGVAGAIFSGAGVTFSSVTGSAAGALAIYRHNSGAAGTWVLVLYEDTGVTGLPVTPNGGNITIGWSASGIFSLGANS
jgi:hypothetical protein